MFCTKCGNEIGNDALFCTKCGANINNDIPTKVSSQPLNTKEQADIRKYIDNHIKENTKFDSVDDLLKNSKSLNFIWICMLIGVVIWSSALIKSFSTPSFETIMFVLVTVVTGYVIAYFVGVFVKFKLQIKTYGFAENIDLNKMTSFMECNMKYLDKYYTKFNLEDENCINIEYKERISLKIKFDKTEERNYYYIFPSKIKDGRIFVLLDDNFMTSRTNTGFGEYDALCKSIPIINAVIQFYLENNCNDNT